MNASPYHSKVKVTLKFADTQFAAGDMVTGKMELECKAEKGLGISVIMAELYAVEGELYHDFSPWWHIRVESSFVSYRSAALSSLVCDVMQSKPITQQDCSLLLAAELLSQCSCCH